MSSLISDIKFLLDENVRHELYILIKSLKVDVMLVPKSSTDKQIAAISLKEKRILVTNDSDFSFFTKDEVFGLIWLKVPQKDLHTLISSFKKMLEECTNYQGFLIFLEVSKWKAKKIPV